MSAIALNHDGNLLATASDKGQIIRIFVTDTGQQIQELRRGTDTAEVISLSFDPVSKYIGCTSDKGTVHIFSIRSDVSLAAMTHKQLEEITSPVRNDSGLPAIQPITPTFYAPEGLS